MKRLLLAAALLCAPVLAYAQSAGTLNLPSGFGVNTPASLSAQVNAQLTTKIDTSRIGVASGVASLDSTTHVPVAQLPLATTGAAGAMQVGTGLGVSSGTVSVQYGTTAGTAAQGNDSRITGAIPSAKIGAANGVAALDSSAHVPFAQLPTGGANFPGSSDDSSVGFAVGNTWEYKGAAYTALQVAPGQAVWQPVQTPLPLDNYSYGVTAATVTAGGSGYTAGTGTVTLSNGTVLNVTAAGGGVTTVNSITTAGNWGCTAPSNPVVQVSTTLGGTGATFTVTVPRFVGYGVARLTACYPANGPAYDLTLVANGVTTTKTIDLLNGVADQAAAAQFCSPSVLTCYVTKWYDQGGGGFDASQATLANAPIFWSPTKISGYNPIVFNGQQYATGLVPAHAAYLSTSTTYAWNENAFDLFVAGDTLTSRQENILVEDPSSSHGFGTFSGFGSLTFIGAGAKCGSGLPAQTQPSVTSVEIVNHGYSCFSGNQVQSGTTNLTGGPYAGLTIGSKNASQLSGAANFDSLAVIFANNIALTPAQVNLINQSLDAEFDLRPQASVNALVADGDSTVTGRGSVLDNSWVKLAQPLINEPISVFNTSQSGQTIAGLIKYFSTGPGLVYSSGTYKKFIVMNDDFPNGIRNNSSATAIEANIKTYVNMVHSLGSNSYIIYMIPMEQCDIFNDSVEFATYQTIVNWLMTQGTASQASGGAGADGIMNIWSDPTIGPGNFTATPPFCSSTYSADSSQHPNDLGMQFFAPYLAQAVNAILDK